jgi:hypothetical protein
MSSQPRLSQDMQKEIRGRNHYGNYGCTIFIGRHETLGTQTREPYPSSLTDSEWKQIARLLPPQKPFRRRPRCHRRDILDALFSIVRTGLIASRFRAKEQGKAGPKDVVFVRLGARWPKRKFA